MLDTSPLRLSIGENVETLLRAHFILVSLCTFSLFPGSRAIGSKTPKKKKIFEAHLYIKLSTFRWRKLIWMSYSQSIVGNYFIKIQRLSMRNKHIKTRQLKYRE